MQEILEVVLLLRTVTTIRKDVDIPNGQPLFRYHCSDRTFAELETGLRRAVTAKGDARLPRKAASAFCFYAAEWFRRNYESWKWRPVLDSLGAFSEEPGPRLYETIERGLDWWNRSVRVTGTHRSYLGTLVCEGGLPMRLLERERATLPRFFRALLRDLSTYGDSEGFPWSPSSRAESLAPRFLPSNLQHDFVYELAGELVSEVLRLRHIVHDAEDPVGALEQRVPEWREQMPLRVDDDVARRFLNGFVRESAALAGLGRTLGLDVTFEREGTNWRAVRTVRGPRRLAAEALRSLLGAGCAELPPRLSLFVVKNGTEHRLVGMATRRFGDDGGGYYRIELGSRELRRFESGASTDDFQLEARSGDDRWGPLPIPGGDRLGELPWVLRTESDTPETPPRKLTLFGQGTVRSTRTTLWAAIPQGEEGWDAHAEDGDVENVGEFLEGRVLLRVQGIAKLISTNDGSICRVRTHAPEDDNGELVALGKTRRFLVGAAPVHIGIPQLQWRAENAPVRRVDGSEVQWRPSGSRNGWRPLAPNSDRTPWGDVVARLNASDGVQGELSLTTLPAEFEVRLEPEGCESGFLILRGVGAARIGVEPTNGVSWEQTTPYGARESRIRLTSDGDAPAAVRVHFEWSDERTTSLFLPFPAQGVRFVGRDLRVLPNQALIHRDCLAGHAATATAPNRRAGFLLTGRLNGRAVHGDGRLPEFTLPLNADGTDGNATLDLQRIQEMTSLLLALDTNHDAAVELRVDSWGGTQLPSQRVRVCRHDGILAPLREEGQVELRRDTGGSFPFPERVVQRLRVDARPIDEPNLIVELSPTEETGRWRFAPEARRPGPWLILGWDGAWCRLRPLLWTVPGVPDLPAREDSLAAAVHIADKRLRREAFARCLRRLAEDPSSPDWALLDAWLATLSDLPCTTFEGVRELVRHPETAALALLRKQGPELDDLFSGLERLPFSWSLVPVTAWRFAAERLASSIRCALQKAGLPKEQVNELVASAFRGFLQDGPRLRAGLTPIGPLLRLDIEELGLSSESLASLARMDSQSQRAWFHGKLEETLRSLRATHAGDKRWPTWDGLSAVLHRMRRETRPHPELETLEWEAPRGLGYQWAVVNAPCVAAVVAATGASVSPRETFEFRRLRRFDPVWFDTAHSLALQIALGVLLSNP